MWDVFLHGGYTMSRNDDKNKKKIEEAAVKIIKKNINAFKELAKWLDFIKMIY